MREYKHLRVNENNTKKSKLILLLCECRITTHQFLMQQYQLDNNYYIIAMSRVYENLFSLVINYILLCTALSASLRILF